MSYEGFEQHICKNGHRFQRDSIDDYDFTGKKPQCACGACSAFANYVDLTNGDNGDAIVNWKPLELTPEVVEVCNLGHTHTIVEATYRIPKSREEVESLRSRPVRLKVNSMEAYTFQLLVDLKGGR